MTKKKAEKKKKKVEGCIVCGQWPILSQTDMCGPCTFGTADAIGEGDVWPEKSD